MISTKAQKPLCHVIDQYKNITNQFTPHRDPQKPLWKQRMVKNTANKEKVVR